MTLTQEINSWFAPDDITTASAPAPGDKAPRPVKLDLKPDQPTVIAFLRHCGCPFAEKTFLCLREVAASHSDIVFIAVSHSEEAHTQHWLKSLPQHDSEPANLRVIVDTEREAYAAYGLGTSSWAHVLAPAALASVFHLGHEENITNRPTESGSRWQTSGAFVVGPDGLIKWGGPAIRSDHIPDFEEGVASLEA